MASLGDFKISRMFNSLSHARGLLAFVNVPRGCTIEQFASLLREPNFYKSTSRSIANNFIAEIEQKLQMLFPTGGLLFYGLLSNGEVINLSLNDRFFSSSPSVTYSNFYHKECLDALLPPTTSFLLMVGTIHGLEVTKLTDSTIKQLSTIRLEPNKECRSLLKEHSIWSSIEGLSKDLYLAVTDNVVWMHDSIREHFPRSQIRMIRYNEGDIQPVWEKLVSSQVTLANFTVAKELKVLDDLFQFQFDPNRSLLGLQESFASVKSSRVQKLIVHKDSEAAIHEFPDGHYEVLPGHAAAVPGNVLERGVRQVIDLTEWLLFVSGVSHRGRSLLDEHGGIGAILKHKGKKQTI